MKKTLVLGASPHSWRVSHSAVLRLHKKGYEVIALGNQQGNIGPVPITTDRPELSDVDTVTVYLNPSNQKEYYDYLLRLKPRRIIFNPGAENPELVQLAREKGIEVELACTLVMLSLDAY